MQNPRLGQMADRRIQETKGRSVNMKQARVMVIAMAELDDRNWLVQTKLSLGFRYLNRV